MKMRTTYSWVAIIGVFLCFGGFMPGEISAKEDGLNMSGAFHFSEGEIITYSVKKLGITIGHSTLTYQGIKKHEGRDLMLITFKTEVAKFEGLEKIYLDPETYYPVVVERDINIFGRKEDIIERYSQKKKEVEITKKVKGKTTAQTIQGESVLENVQGFIFRYRKQGAYEIGEEMEVTLPLSHVKLELQRIEPLEIDGTTYTSFFVEGHPRNLRIWFDMSKNHVPLRIDGNFGVGRVSLVLNKYEHL